MSAPPAFDERDSLLDLAISESQPSEYRADRGAGEATGASGVRMGGERGPGQGTPPEVDLVEGEGFLGRLGRPGGAARL